MSRALGLKEANSKFVESEVLNNFTYLDYYKRLRLLAMSMFEWVNLPKGINERYMEKVLYLHGRALMFKDPTKGYMAMQCIPSAELNWYEESTQYTAFSINYNETYDRDSCVLLRNNYEEIPTDMTIQLFAHRLYEVERTLDVNIKSQKTPVLIRCQEKEKMTMKNLYMQYDGNQPFIFGYKNLDVDGFKVLKTDSPYVGDKLMIYKHNIWNEAMTFLGIKNSNTDKKERLVTEEANANNEMVTLSSETMLLTRKQACKWFNDMYGEEIDVKLRTYDEKEMDVNE